MVRVETPQGVFTVPGKSNLLRELEEAGANPAHSCRQGHCGECRRTLIKGKVLHTDNLVTLGRGEILLCCAIAKTNLKIGE